MTGHILNNKTTNTKIQKKDTKKGKRIKIQKLKKDTKKEKLKERQRETSWQNTNWNKKVQIQKYKKEKGKRIQRRETSWQDTNWNIKITIPKKKLYKKGKGKRIQRQTEGNFLTGHKLKLLFLRTTSKTDPPQLLQTYELRNIVIFCHELISEQCIQN